MPRHLLHFLLIAVLASVLTTACDSFGSFGFTEESDPITVEGRSSVLNGLPLAELFPTHIPLEVNLEQELAKQDASGARSVHLTELYFELTDETAEPDFDFLNRITLQVSAADADLPRHELAWSDPVPEGQTRFYFDIDEDLDLKPYAEAGLRLRTNVSGSAPSQDAVFRVVARFRVNVL